MADADTLLDQALHLPLGERARFILRLAESLDAHTDADADEAWAEEIGDRVRALRQGDLRTVSSDAAFASAKTRIARPRD